MPLDYTSLFGTQRIAAASRQVAEDAPASLPMRAGDKIRRNPSTDQKKARRRVSKTALDMAAWRARLEAQTAALRSAKSPEEVFSICPPIDGVSIGRGFWEGDGDEMWGALTDAGWSTVTYDAAYYWCMESPSGGLLSYIEGDLEPGNQLVPVTQNTLKSQRDASVQQPTRPGGYIVNANRKTAGARIEQFRRILETATMGEVDGQVVDTFSASAVVQVYDALSPKNKEKFESFSPAGMVDTAFKLINKTSAKMGPPTGKVPTCIYCDGPVVWDGGLWHCETPNAVYGQDGCGAMDYASWVWPDDVKTAAKATCGNCGESAETNDEGLCSRCAREAEESWNYETHDGEGKPYPKTSGYISPIQAAVQRALQTSASVDPELGARALAYWGGVGASDSLNGFVSRDGLYYSWEGDTTLVCLNDGAFIEFRRSGDGWEYKDDWGVWNALPEVDLDRARREFEDYERRQDEYRQRQKVTDPEGYRRWLGGD